MRFLSLKHRALPLPPTGRSYMVWTLETLVVEKEKNHGMGIEEAKVCGQPATKHGEVMKLLTLISHTAALS